MKSPDEWTEEIWSMPTADQVYLHDVSLPDIIRRIQADALENQPNTADLMQKLIKSEQSYMAAQEQIRSLVRLFGGNPDGMECIAGESAFFQGVKAVIDQIGSNTAHAECERHLERARQLREDLIGDLASERKRSQELKERAEKVERFVDALAVILGVADAPVKWSAISSRLADIGMRVKDALHHTKPGDVLRAILGPCNFGLKTDEKQA